MSITGFTPIVDASGNWVAFDGSGSVIANTVGLGVNIDDSEPFSDVTALLKAANIITADQEAQGSFHGELTQDNMAKLLQEAGKSSASDMQALTKLITAGNYTIQDTSGSNAVTFGTLSITGGNVVASPKETGSGYVYELNTVMLGASADKAAPLTGTPNFAVSFKVGGNSHPISLVSYRVEYGDHLFSDVSIQRLRK